VAPLFILLAAVTYAIAAPQTGPRAVVVVSLVAYLGIALGGPHHLAELGRA